MNRKSKILIIVLINIVLVVLFFTLVLLSGNSELSADLKQTFSTGKTIVGLIIGIESIASCIYYVIKSTAKTKKLSISRDYSVVSKSMWKSLLVVFLLFSYGVFFMVASLFLYVSPESQESTFYTYQVLYILTMTFTVSIFFIVCYYQFLKKNIVPKWKETIRFGSLIENRNRIPIRELQGYFHGDKDFYDKLLRWVELFNLSIEVDAIILNDENIDEFMKSLDDLYREWNS